MTSNKLLGIAERGREADTSAVCAINRHLPGVWIHLLHAIITPLPLAVPGQQQTTALSGRPAIQSPALLVSRVSDHAAQRTGSPGYRAGRQPS
jgi:hypothetical protein